jgi:hypothetical protein
VPEPNLTEGRRWRRSALVASVVLPLGVVALAYGLLWLSDRLVYIGPLDRAQFGWIVVVPIWLSAPAAAALVWSRLDPGRAPLAAVAIALVIGAVAAVMFWSSVAFPNCVTAPAHAPADWILPAALLGATTGGGIGVSALLGLTALRARDAWFGVATAMGSEAVASGLALVVLGAQWLPGNLCQRPFV